MKRHFFRQGHLLAAFLLLVYFSTAPYQPTLDRSSKPVTSGQVLNTAATPTPTPTPSLAPPPSAAPAVTAKPRPARSTTSAIGQLLYVEPNGPAARQAAAWRTTHPADAARMDRMAATPHAKWVGDWTPDPYLPVKNYVSAAAATRSLPVLVLYNLPGRDCGSFSAGGAANATVYQAWIERVSAGLGQLPVIIILEPDALAQDCYTAEQRAAVASLLSQAVTTLKRNPNARVYLDSGNPRWQSATTMAARLKSAGIAAADGFALNVSNFHTTAANLSYGSQISSLTGGKHFVIDTSRNGAGSNGEWCNPTGRALGQPPTTRTGHPLADAYLWIKTPGQSDGTCNRGEPRAGVWWPDYALDLAIRAGY